SYVRQATIDALTGCKNRRAFDSDIAALMNDHQPFALALVDIDNFKSINDTWGHLNGDIVLRNVAREGLQVLQPLEISLYRYGGEEFVVVLPGVSLAHATAIAERIQQKIREAGLPHAASAVASEVTVSIGIVASDGTVPIETLIARADSALYQAKNKGRNQWS
ncbi:diguanylate cyclase, partial [Enterobacter kobei]|uniref:diguanylate cyclase n=1 Tax=Enterobacter kobei TaxID=208224 RepID=UPI0029D9748E